MPIKHPHSHGMKKSILNSVRNIEQNADRRGNENDGAGYDQD